MPTSHESQRYEWLPSNQGLLEEVPDPTEERRAWHKTAPTTSMVEMSEVADRMVVAANEGQTAPSSAARPSGSSRPPIAATPTEGGNCRWSADTRRSLGHQVDE